MLYGQNEETRRVFTLRLLFLSTVKTLTVPSDGALQSVQGLTVGFHDPDIFALETTSPAQQLQTTNEFISVSAGLRQKIGVTWRKSSFKANVSNDSRGATQGILGLQHGLLLRREVRSKGQFEAARTWGRRFVSTFRRVTSRPVCGRVYLHSQTRDPKVKSIFKNPFYDLKWLTSKDAEGEGREFVAAEGRIILVTDDMMDSGNERRPNADAKHAREVSFWQVSCPAV